MSRNLTLLLEITNDDDFFLIKDFLRCYMNTLDPNSYQNLHLYETFSEGNIRSYELILGSNYF